MRQEDAYLLLPLNIIVKNATETRHDLGLSKSHFHHLKKSVAKSLVVPLDKTIECETAYGIIDQRGETPGKPSLKLDVIWLLGQTLEASPDCINDSVLVAKGRASPACDQQNQAPGHCRWRHG
jgi:hypothetical protein